MHEAVIFIMTALSVFSAFFTLGASAVLYLQHRTRILRVAFLFILSILLIDLAFAVRAFIPLALAPEGDILPAITFFEFAGVVLNIVIVPFLVAVILSASPGKITGALLACWNGLAGVFCVLYPFVPDVRPIQLAVTAQMLLTIGGSLTVLFTRLSGIRPLRLRKAVTAFLAASSVFLVLLILDISASLVPLPFLFPVDNLSLPLYFFALNAGLFFFLRSFLSSGPLVSGGRVTDGCRTAFGLTEREAGIIGCMLAGKTNQEVADTLFISKKTVENHLNNIYRKMQAKNRMQLLQTLQNWKSEI